MREKISNREDQNILVVVRLYHMTCHTSSYDRSNPWTAREQPDWPEVKGVVVLLDHHHCCCTAGLRRRSDCLGIPLSPQFNKTLLLCWKRRNTSVTLTKMSNEPEQLFIHFLPARWKVFQSISERDRVHFEDILSTTTLSTNRQWYLFWHHDNISFNLYMVFVGNYSR